MTRLLEVYRPDEIAFVTFTRKGVDNGKERALLANPQLTREDLVHFKTLHSLCFRELGLKHDAVLDPLKMDKFNKLSGGYFNIALHEAFDKQTEDDKLLSCYDAVRNGATKGVVVNYKCSPERYNRFVNMYEEFKKANGLVDFHDCLLRFCERGLPVNVKAAFIDEAQDLTPLQWEVCRIAFSLCEKIRISGDDFQSLFVYSGASPGTLIALAKKYHRIKLEKSYRLPKSVYRFAKGITRLIEDKIDKDFVPEKTRKVLSRKSPTGNCLCSG
jgi:superfamily I DNA/RNA helicase